MASARRFRSCAVVWNGFSSSKLGDCSGELSGSRNESRIGAASGCSTFGILRLKFGFLIEDVGLASDSDSRRLWCAAERSGVGCNRITYRDGGLCCLLLGTDMPGRCTAGLPAPTEQRVVEKSQKQRSAVHPTECEPECLGLHGNVLPTTPDRSLKNDVNTLCAASFLRT